MTRLNRNKPRPPDARTCDEARSERMRKTAEKLTESPDKAEEMASLYRQAAELGDGQAIYWVACARIRDSSDPRRFETAFALFRSAADGGSVAAHIQVSSMYLHGLGTQRNVEIALQHLAIAARLGDSTADCRWRWMMALEGFLWTRARAFS